MRTILEGDVSPCRDSFNLAADEAGKRAGGEFVIMGFFMMFSAGSKQLKVVAAVVQRIAIDVVDHLSSLKLASKGLLHDIAMFINPACGALGYLNERSLNLIGAGDYFDRADRDPGGAEFPAEHLLSLFGIKFFFAGRAGLDQVFIRHTGIIRLPRMGVNV